MDRRGAARLDPPVTASNSRRVTPLLKIMSGVIDRKGNDHRSSIGGAARSRARARVRKKGASWLRADFAKDTPREARPSASP
jgi:hypothetical protein